MKNSTYNEAIDSVVEDLLRLTDEEFAEALRQHKDGDFARILRETNALRARRELSEALDETLALSPTASGLVVSFPVTTHPLTGRIVFDDSVIRIDSGMHVVESPNLWEVTSPALSDAEWYAPVNMANVAKGWTYGTPWVYSPGAIHLEPPAWESWSWVNVAGPHRVSLRNSVVSSHVTVVVSLGTRFEGFASQDEETLGEFACAA